ncbi:MAG: hypothetical protein HETSPECPRED_002649 [Heterodermia speciosa]|uniref:Uncharacterized protein n=1 Tax=Heterodermia speciosa TaxID=116794 RepID=A0A8H3J5A6_9LECA|nr:MAG: hypothetical protein HETSPECPRED_002649 [Heterodermia speciosa]
MTSQAAVHSPSSERSDSSQSNLANGHEPNHLQTFTNHGDLNFPFVHFDTSPPRASRRSFEIDLATLQNPELERSVTTEPNRGTGQPSPPAPMIDARHERPSQRPDGLSPESSHAIRDPFPEQRVPSALSAHPTSPTSIYHDDGLLPVSSSQPPSTSTQRNIPTVQPTSPNPPPTSAPLPSTQPTSLPAPIPAFDGQRATHVHHPPSQLIPPPTAQQASSSPQPPPSTTITPLSHPETLQPTTSTTSPPRSNNHHPGGPRDRSRRRFARWIRRRFRRQLPWLEGWLHGREGSERREARRAIRAAEEAGFR